jgi:16S rRNA (cytosine967-C5)-methyltransferase
MPISPARTAAFDILLRVERKSSFASELLHSDTYQSLSTADHALATELVMGVLRWRSRLDEEIGEASTQPLAKLDLEILVALRLALYQIRWLDRIPARAAINESVELVKRARKRSAAPFVNAVLRKLAAKASLPKQPTEVQEAANSAAGIAQSRAHPLWLVERWTKQYGLATTLKICQYDQTIPTTAIRLRAPAVETELDAEAIQLAPGSLLANARRVRKGDVTKTHALRNRQIVIQDEASQLVAALVGAESRVGSRILDCCAAPGGKTLAIADRNPGANITAVDLHPHRARLLKKLLPTPRTTDCEQLPNVHIVVADSRHFPFTLVFDRVLTDMPCSGTGTLARNPEIKWRLQPHDLADLAETQLAILISAISQLAPAGRLIYSTCSLEKEENENVIERALLRNTSVRVLDCRLELERLKTQGELICPDLDSLTSGPYLRTIPGTHPCEGFFAAILESDTKKIYA